MRSLVHRNDRLKLRRLSLRADLLKQRISGTGLDFRHLMQADFVLFLRAAIEPEGFVWGWWPETLLYAHRSHRAFEVFARSKSKTFFDKVKCMLLIEKPENLKGLLEAYISGERELPRWKYDSFSPAVLLGYDDLATIP